VDSGVLESKFAMRYLVCSIICSVLSRTTSVYDTSRIDNQSNVQKDYSLSIAIQQSPNPTFLLSLNSVGKVPENHVHPTERCPTISSETLPSSRLWQDHWLKSWLTLAHKDGDSGKSRILLLEIQFGCIPS